MKKRKAGWGPGLSEVLEGAPAAIGLREKSHNEGADKGERSTHHKSVDRPCQSHGIASSRYQRRLNLGTILQQARRKCAAMRQDCEDSDLFVAVSPCFHWPKGGCPACEFAHA